MKFLTRKETIPLLPSIKRGQTVAIDLETCDPDLKTKAPGWVHGNGHICGVCLAVGQSSFYLPIGHEQGTNLHKEAVLEYVQRLIDTSKEIVFHNAHYDVGWLMHEGIKITKGVNDTMLAAPLINENRYNYSLDALAREYLPNSKGKDEDILYRAVKDQYQYDYDTTVTMIRIKNIKTGRVSTRILANWESEPNKDLFKIVQEPYDQPTVKTFKISKKEAKGYLWRLDPKDVEAYGKQDALLTLNLWNYFRPQLLAQDLKRVYRLEAKLIMPLIHLRKKGIKIDVERANELREKYTKIINKQEKILTKLVGQPVSITNKSGSLVKACNKLGIPYGFTAEGNASFAEENIPEGYDFFYEPLKIARKYTKARDVFINAYLSYLIGDRIHPQFNQLKSDDGGTVTGRFSCSSPNIQNIPARDPEIGPELRSIFIPEDGELWLTLDYSSQEPRMLVHLAIMLGRELGINKCPSAIIAMEERFCGRDSDFHTEVAKAVINTEYLPKIEKLSFKQCYNYYSKEIADLKWVHHPLSEDEFIAEFKDNTGVINFLYKKFRKPAKFIGLGVMYGRGVPSIVEGLRLDGIHMEVDEAAEIKKAVIKAVPFLEMVDKHFQSVAAAYGFVTTLLGRRGRFPDFEVVDFTDWIDEKKVPEDKRRRKIHYYKTKDEAVKARDKMLKKIPEQYHDKIKYPKVANVYKALNKVIQGSSADQTKQAILDFYEQGYIDKMRMTVHDEISFSIKPDEDVEQYRNIMEFCLPLNSKSKCDPSTGRNWHEAK